MKLRQKLLLKLYNKYFHTNLPDPDNDEEVLRWLMDPNSDLSGIDLERLLARIDERLAEIEAEEAAQRGETAEEPEPETEPEEEEAVEAPKTYGLGIEFTVAQWKGEEIHEGFLVTGIILPMVVPVDCPLWILAIATAFAVIFAKEIFGGTGMNIVNVALIARAFLFFAYPSKMSGDSVWIRTTDVCGLGAGNVIDGFSGATPLGQVATSATSHPVITDAAGNAVSIWDAICGFIPGSIGETSVIAIALGAILLLCTGIASWKTMCSVFVGGALTAFLFNISGSENAVANLPWYYHLVLGGFCFGAVFMATDPVTSARTEAGKYIYGFLIGVMAILIRVLNPGYPEGMMLAILLMNVCAPLIDYCVVQVNISKRLKRANKKG